MEAQTVARAEVQDFDEIEASEGLVHLDGVIAADDSEEENIAAVPVNLTRLDSGSHGLGSL